MCDRDFEEENTHTPPTRSPKRVEKEPALRSDRRTYSFLRRDDDDAFVFDPFLLPTLVETRQKRERVKSFGSLRVISTAAAAAFCCWCLMTLF